jgi:hypothetical protein
MNPVDEKEKQTITYDLGGKATLAQMADQISARASSILRLSKLEVCNFSSFCSPYILGLNISIV